jgi:hypothetical protein
MMRAFEEDRTSAAVALVERIPVFAESPAIAAALRALHGTSELEAVVGQWWEQSMVPEFPPEWRPFARELYRL